MQRFKFALCLSLTALLACAPVQTPPPQQYTPPSYTPTIAHEAASGCEGEHDTISLRGGYINAFPAWPPNAQPEHIVLHYDNGTSVWGKPSYGTADCSDYMTCRRATFILNPTYNQCVPEGHLYEIATLDDRPVLQSSLLQVIEPTTKATVYIGFACGRGFGGASVPAIANQIMQSGCLSQPAPSQMNLSPTAPPAASPPTAPAQGGGHPYLHATVEVIGLTLAAAAVLGAAYFGYRASVVNAQAQNNAAMNERLSVSPPVSCTTSELSDVTWSTRCH